MFMSQEDLDFEETEAMFFNTYYNLIVEGRKEDALMFLSIVRALSFTIASGKPFMVTFDDGTSNVPQPDAADGTSDMQMELPLLLAKHRQ
jgi:hypothetical protein